MWGPGLGVDQLSPVEYSGVEPFPDQPVNTSICDATLAELSQYAAVQIVEESTDVRIHDGSTMKSHTPVPQLVHPLKGALAWPKSI